MRHAVHSGWVVSALLLLPNLLWLAFPGPQSASSQVGGPPRWVVGLQPVEMALRASVFALPFFLTVDLAQPHGRAALVVACGALCFSRSGLSSLSHTVRAALLLPARIFTRQVLKSVSLSRTRSSSLPRPPNHRAPRIRRFIDSPANQCCSSLIRSPAASSAASSPSCRRRDRTCSSLVSIVTPN